jgi:Fic family protein
MNLFASKIWDYKPKEILMIARIGELKEQTAGYKALIPLVFPPAEGLKFSPNLIVKHSRAERSIGKLDGITQLLPDDNFFILMYIRRDAAASSQIEGTQATMIDAIEAEAKTTDTLPKDVDDIRHYIAALNYGLNRLKELPLSLRFIRELHRELMQGARTTRFSNPGEFRQSQNWIGGSKPENARFVPPPPREMQKALEDFEQFLHAKDDLLPLVKAGLIHAQFETIHPFLDGNGRTGRLLVTMYLWLTGLLERPVLFLSSYFKKHQQEYYDRLHGYHQGEVEEWLEFFLDGVIEISSTAIAVSKHITTVRQEDMEKVQSLGKTASESAVNVLRQLFGLPVVNHIIIQRWTGYTQPGAQRVIDRLVELNILEQKDKGAKHGKVYIYRRYVDAFNVD